jgi:hypothetical protein
LKLRSNGDDEDEYAATILSRAICAREPGELKTGRGRAAENDF